MEPETKVRHKQWSVILAFTLPIVLILGVLFSSNASFLKAETDYDFVYAICNLDGDRYLHYDECQGYLLDVIQIDENGNFYTGEVNDSRDTDQDGVLDKDESYKIRYFYHNSKANQSREILTEELTKYSLSPLLSSPDGATIEYGYNGSPDILFFDVGSGGYEYRLVKESRTKLLNIIKGTNNRYYGNQNFTFVGWVIGQN